MEQFFVFLCFTVIIVIALFTPALLELKKPKDAGPREIVGFKTGVLLQAKREPEFSSKALNANISDVFDSLTNLEV
ncbi:MAG: hypothetical protein ACFCUE_08130 [Candidatus Bathyarchaeia archaeon]|jgi:hypothetical protein